MKQYTINIELTDAEDAALQESIDPAKTNAVIFQQFWDGYIIEDDFGKQVMIIGSIRAQVTQWIRDKNKSIIDEMDEAEVLAKLKA